MRGAVFAYHSQNCGGYDYASNDHLAFASDLQAIADAGVPIVSLEHIARCLNTHSPAALPERFVGLSCDDGTLLDWADYDHPAFGMQKSLANILRDHVSAADIEPQGLLTAFVIASPEARSAIDTACYDGIPLSDDGWWLDAAREGLLHLGNHSFDHVHASLPVTLQRYGVPGDFSSVDNYALANQQIARATEQINAVLAQVQVTANVFAYPYGHTNDYLTQHYLPEFANEHRMWGGYTTEQAYVESATSCFRIPRFVCGDAWHSPQGFAAILDGLFAV